MSKNGTSATATSCTSSAGSTSKSPGWRWPAVAAFLTVCYLYMASTYSSFHLSSLGLDSGSLALKAKKRQQHQDFQRWLELPGASASALGRLQAVAARGRGDNHHHCLCLLCCRTGMDDETREVVDAIYRQQNPEDCSKAKYYIVPPCR